MNEYHVDKWIAAAIDSGEVFYDEHRDLYVENNAPLQAALAKGMAFVCEGTLYWLIDVDSFGWSAPEPRDFRND